MHAFPLTPEQTALCRQMADLAGLGGFIVDLTAGRCLWCADEVARIHGLQVADCLDLLSAAPALLERIAPEDRDGYEKARAKAIQRGRSYAVRYRLRRQDGTVRVVKEVGERVADAGSGQRRLVGTLQDVTEATAAEEALQRANELLERRVAERTAALRAANDAALAAEREAKKSQDRFVAAAEALMDGLAIYDGDDRLVYFNSRYPEHAPPSFRGAMKLGARFEDMVRAAVAGGGMYHSDMGASFVERRLSDHRAPAEDREFRIADGRWVRVRESALAGGGRVLLTSDITEQKRAQEALEEREQLLETVANGIPLPIAIARISQPEILFANELATEMFGLRIGPQREAIRAGYLNPPDRKTLIERLFRDGRVDGFEVQLRRVDGTIMWALLSARAIMIGGQLAMLLTATDITERKAAQVELEEREERFRAIAEGVPLSVLISRTDPPEILFANAPAFETFGLKIGLEPEAIRAMYARGEDRRRLLDQLAAEGSVDAFEVELRGRDGATMWCLMSARGVAFGGRPAVLTAITDVTQLKSMQQALQESEARLAAFMENAPVGMYLKDRKGRYVLLNPEMGKVLGTDVEDMLGRTVGDSAIGKAAAAFIAARDREVMTTGRVVVCEEHLPNLGQYIWDLVIRFPVRDAEGQITHIGGFDVDITERKAMEEALKISEQRFRAFAEAHPVPLFISQIETGKVIFASPPCAPLLGMSLDEVRSGTTIRFYPDPEHRAKLVDRIRRDGHVEGLEVRLRRADGSEFWAALTSRLIDFEGEDAMVTAVVDLTERKRVEAELARQRQVLHQNEKMSALGSLLAGVAHELNNPLSVVVGHASLLEDFATDAAIRDRALKIRTAADRCARIVRTFLAMARSKPRQRSAVRLNATIEEALEIVAYGLRTADVEVVRALAPDLPAVWADGDQLHQVFANLFVNAQQALQGVPPPRRLTITSDFDDEAVWVAVADNGPGIPADIAQRVFEPFFTTKPQGVGTGVGLSVCHGIVAAHDGEIRLEASGGPGARFVVRLPRTAAQVVEAPVETLPRRHRRARILVVDDEPDVAQLLIDILERDGHRVARASSGREALACLADGEVDLILSDLRMPDLDGPALYRALAAQRPELLGRLVFMTGDTLGGDMTGFLTETGVRVLEKPLDPAGVSHKVQGFLAARVTAGRVTPGSGAATPGSAMPRGRSAP
jgi:PAS domain S-box-containing protein